MWLIVAIVLAAGGKPAPLPLAIGPSLLFARAEDCAAAAKLYAAEAKQRGLGIGCTFVPVYGGKQQEAF